MKKIGLSVLLCLMAGILIMCTEKKTEEEQYMVAYELYNNQEYQKAIDHFKIVIDKYPNGKFTATSTLRHADEQGTGKNPETHP